MNSDKMVNVKEPSFDKHGRRQGLWIITYETKDGKKYDAHMDKTGYELAVIKDKLREKGYDMSLINEFEYKVRADSESRY